ncbi:MAG: hypothetical protein ACAF41_25145 [Leptolyngbya sp. BL-A-14]
MTTCPLCSDILLRHLRSGKPYWLCRRCRIELLEKKDLAEKITATTDANHKALSLHNPIHQPIARPSAVARQTLEPDASIGRMPRRVPHLTTEA